MADKVTIKIPRELYTRLGEMVEGTGFSSVTEFIVFILRALASSGESDEAANLTLDEIKGVKRMLSRLGYLNDDE